MVAYIEQTALPKMVPPKPVHHRRANPSNAAAAIYDAGLVRRFNAGDEAAFMAIMTRYRGLIFSVALGVLKNRGDAEEITQDTFLCAHRGLGEFRGDSSLATWLNRIARNLSHNRYWYFYRRCRHASVSLDSALCEQSNVTFSDLVTTDAVGPSRNVLISEFTELISIGMAQLGRPQRDLLAMTQHHSYAEIAQRFHISIGTVKSRIARARERLRVLMSEECPEFNAAERCVEWFEPVRSTGGIEAMSS